MKIVHRSVNVGYMPKRIAPYRYVTPNIRYSLLYIVRGNSLTNPNPILNEINS